MATKKTPYKIFTESLHNQVNKNIYFDSNNKINSLVLFRKGYYESIENIL